MGKTTVGKQLQASGVGTFIDHNAILTFIAGIAGNDDGIYDQIADLELAICKKLLTQGQTVIVARGFSKVGSMAPYTHVANQLGTEVAIIRLEATGAELENRVKSPERKLDFNPTVTVAELRKWVSENPLQPHSHEQKVNNEQPLAQVITHIVDSIST